MAKRMDDIYPADVRRADENAIVVTLDDGRTLRFAKGWADIWIAMLSAAWDEPIGTVLDQGEAYEKQLKAGDS